jgi:hypothetical protein
LWYGGGALLIGTAGWWALLEIAVLAYFAIVGFMIVFIFAEFLLFPERSARRVLLWHGAGGIQSEIGLLEPYFPSYGLDTKK